jgi:hypothetical protein
MSSTVFIGRSMVWVAATLAGVFAHLHMQDGCNRSVWGGRRGNVFVESHHSDIPDRDIGLHSVTETAFICIDLSSAGSKPRPARWG